MVAAASEHGAHPTRLQVVDSDSDAAICCDDNASLLSLATLHAHSSTSGPAIAVLDPPAAPGLGLRATSEDVVAIAERCFRKPFAFVGLYAPIILAVMLKLRVTVAIGTVFLDAVEEGPPVSYTPW